MKIRLFVSSIIFVILCSCSESNNSEKCLLWKITGNEQTTPSYLFGILNASCKPVFNASVINALANSQQVYLEHNPDDPNIPSEIEREMHMKGGATIKSILSPADFDILDDYFQKNIGISIYSFNTEKPEFINIKLSQKLIDCPDMRELYEVEIGKIAKKGNKKILGLETMGEFMKMYDIIPYKAQAEGLVYKVKDNLQEAKKNVSRLATLYKDQDIENLRLATLTTKNKNYAEYTKVILTDRNIKWTSKIKKAINEKPTFFAVGVSHLAGEEGLIALLQKGGYTVEPIY